MRGRLVILSGPSGVGKDTVIDRWHELDPLVTRVVAHTTRPPRPGEIHRVDYVFSTPEEFHERAQRGEFLEFKEVHGNWYATPKTELEALLANGRIAVLKIDVEGGISVLALRDDATSILLEPPSMEELERRIRGRGTESEAKIQERLHNARRELERGRVYQHRVTNGDLDATVGELRRLSALKQLD